MAQTTALMDTLKKALKAQGKTYLDVALALDLTEASVKRLFSEQNFSVKRLDQVCQMLGIEISDLVKMMNESQPQINQLSEEQEWEIANDIELLLVTISVLNKWTFEQILGHYNLTEPQCIRKLAKLDKLKIIELLPKNRVKLRVAPNFKWRENGPIQRFFQEKVEADFFRSRFTGEAERLIVINGMLSAESNRVFQRKMEKLAKEFDELNMDDTRLPLDQKFGNTVVIAIRQWQYGLFDHLVKGRK